MALAFLSGLAAAADEGRKAQPIPVPSIAAMALPVTGTLEGPAISADLTTSTSETSLGASVKLTGAAVGLRSFGAELGAQSAKPSGGLGALGSSGNGISSGVQASLAVTYANYDLKPDDDPGVKAFEAAARKCGAHSSTQFRDRVRRLAEARAGKADLDEKERALATACTFDESQAYWLVEGARTRPFLVSAKVTLGRSDAIYLATGTYAPTEDLLKVGVSAAIGQYVLSNAVIAASFKWSTGNVVPGAPVNVCRQIATDIAGNPVTQCDTGIVGSPVRGNIYRAAVEVRWLAAGGLVALSPGASISWTDRGAPQFQAQLPVLLQVIPTAPGESSRPLLVGLTAGYSLVTVPAVQHAFSVAGTLQTQFSLDKL